MIKRSYFSKQTTMAALFIASLATGTIVLQGCASRHEKETKTAEQVFARWIAKNQLFFNHDLETYAEHLSDAYIAGSKEKFSSNFQINKEFNPFFASFFNAKTDSPSAFSPVLSAQLKEKLGKIYFMIEHDMPGFVAYLQNNGFESGKLNASDTSANFRDIILRDRGLVEMFFANKDQKIEIEYMRSVANSFFEFCFDPQTWPLFEELLLNEDSHPIVRILYATMWYYMAGNGWKFWNKKMIDQIKAEADKGKTIVYIAGGSDLYQLFYHGIYNINVIDPQLPTQPRYYSEGWDWLIKPDGLGDEMTMTLPDKKLLFRREVYTENGTFKAKLVTGDVADIPQSTTEWVIYEQPTLKKVGTLTFSRRFATQEDFVNKPTELLMISFNELYFIETPSQAKSWGIDPEQFTNDFVMYAKQLRQPLSKNVILNMRKAEKTKFSFIALGTEIN